MPEPETSPPDAPQIIIYAPTGDGVYFPGSPASGAAYYVCSSTVSYIVSCEGDVPLFAPIDVSTAGPHTFTVRARDLEGRTTTKSVTYEVLDVAAPQIDLRTPTDRAEYDLNSNVTVDYSCSDPGGSGVIFCSGRSSQRSTARHELGGRAQIRRDRRRQGRPSHPDARHLHGRRPQPAAGHHSIPARGSFVHARLRMVDGLLLLEPRQRSHRVVQRPSVEWRARSIRPASGRTRSR